MNLKYNEKQRQEYLRMVESNGRHWLEVFQGNTLFYSAVYWDLFTFIWKAGKPVRKTDALRSMTGIKSAQTAGKYLETALQEKILIEEDNPKDARSKLVGISPEMKNRLDLFFDRSVDELMRSSQKIEKAG